MILARKAFSVKNSSVNGWRRGLVALNLLILFENQISLQLSRRNCGCMFEEGSLNHMDFTDFLYINCQLVCFHFLQRLLLHPPCYLRRALFRPKKFSWINKIFFLRPTVSFERHPNSNPHRKFLREHVIHFIWWSL